MPDNSARIAQVKAKMAARTGKPGFKRNVVALQGELVKLNASHVPAVAKPAPSPANPVEAKAT